MADRAWTDFNELAAANLDDEVIAGKEGTPDREGRLTVEKVTATAGALRDKDLPTPTADNVYDVENVKGALFANLPESRDASATFTTYTPPQDVSGVWGEADGSYRWRGILVSTNQVTAAITGDIVLLTNGSFRRRTSQHNWVHLEHPPGWLGGPYSDYTDALHHITATNDVTAYGGNLVVVTAYTAGTTTYAWHRVNEDEADALAARDLPVASLDYVGQVRNLNGTLYACVQHGHEGSTKFVGWGGFGLSSDVGTLWGESADEYRWRGVVTFSSDVSNPGDGDVCLISTHGGFQVYRTASVTVTGWRSLGHPSHWLGSFSNEDEADEAATSTGQVAEWGNRLRIVSSYTAGQTTHVYFQWERIDQDLLSVEFVDALPNITDISVADRTKLFAVVENGGISTLAHLRPTDEDTGLWTVEDSSSNDRVRGFNSSDGYGLVSPRLNITQLADSLDTARTSHQISLNVEATGTIPRENDAKVIYYREQDSTGNWRREPLTGGADGTYLGDIHLNSSLQRVETGKTYEIILRNASSTAGDVSTVPTLGRYTFNPEGLEWVVFLDANALDHTQVHVDTALAGLANNLRIARAVTYDATNNRILVDLPDHVTPPEETLLLVGPMPADLTDSDNALSLRLNGSTTVTHDLTDQVGDGITASQLQSSGYYLVYYTDQEFVVITNLSTGSGGGGGGDATLTVDDPEILYDGLTDGVSFTARTLNYTTGTARTIFSRALTEDDDEKELLFEGFLEFTAGGNDYRRPVYARYNAGQIRTLVAESATATFSHTQNAGHVHLIRNIAQGVENFGEAILYFVRAQEMVDGTNRDLFRWAIGTNASGATPVTLKLLIELVNIHGDLSVSGGGGSSDSEGGQMDESDGVTTVGGIYVSWYLEQYAANMPAANTVPVPENDAWNPSLGSWIQPDQNPGTLGQDITQPRWIGRGAGFLNDDGTVGSVARNVIAAFDIGWSSEDNPNVDTNADWHDSYMDGDMWRRYRTPDGSWVRDFIPSAANLRWHRIWEGNAYPAISGTPVFRNITPFAADAWPFIRINIQPFRNFDHINSVNLGHDALIPRPSQGWRNANYSENGAILRIVYKAGERIDWGFEGIADNSDSDAVNNTIALPNDQGEWDSDDQRLSFRLKFHNDFGANTDTDALQFYDHPSTYNRAHIEIDAIIV